MDQVVGHQAKATLLGHLLELRRRLLYCLGFFTLAFACAYLFAEPVYQFLLQPLAGVFADQGLEGRRMIYTGLHEAFFTYLKVSFFCALFFSLPIVLNQIWKFIAPGLYRQERAFVRPLFLMTPVLFVAGAALAYYLVFPMAWSFFLSFETAGMDGSLPLQLEARVGEYLSLVIQLVFAFGLSFELPLLLLLLAKTGVVTADGLARNRRYAVVIIFAVAALITPPDLISQIALGVPIMLLYELSIFMVRRLVATSPNEVAAQG